MTASALPRDYSSEKKSITAGDTSTDTAAIYCKPQADNTGASWEFDMEIATGQLVTLSNWPLPTDRLLT